MPINILSDDDPIHDLLWKQLRKKKLRRKETKVNYEEMELPHAIKKDSYMINADINH